DYVRIQDVDDRGKGAGEPLGIAVERRPAGRVATRSAGGDFRGVHGTAAVSPVIGGEPRSRQKALDAARAAAIAGRPGPFVGQVELAFLTSPVAATMVPGMPIPTEVRAPISRSMPATSPAIAAIVPA